MGLFKHKLLLILFCFIANNSYSANDSFRIVTDPWPPYAYIDDGKAVGIDVDIALAVLGNMGIKGVVEMLPWKRSLALVKSLGADAILSAAVTRPRKQFLYFPTEPISTGDTVFFKRKERDIVANLLVDLYGLKVGAMLGYKYCEELDNSPLLLKASRVASLEQSFNMLLNDHVDILVSVDAVGFYKAKEMGIAADVSVVSNSRYCSVGNHLAFAKKPDRENMATRFSEALIQFKKTSEYQEILSKYGMGG
ncbi:MAG: polar amino acid transport system substrate-binding protein [Psychromonas sp.]|jgi:polar amino acid transport system substrate-binding protein